MEKQSTKVYTSYGDGATLVDPDWPDPWPVNSAQADVFQSIEADEKEQAIVSIEANEFTKEYAAHNRKRLQAKSIGQVPVSPPYSRADAWDHAGLKIPLHSRLVPRPEGDPSEWIFVMYHGDHTGLWKKRRRLRRVTNQDVKD